VTPSGAPQFSLLGCDATCTLDIHHPLAGPAIAAELEEACFFINLLSDDSWQPWVLEFFYQSDDDAKRAAFLMGAEVLQLYCELKQDEAFKQQR
jgi:hypothetical protein